MVEAEPRRDAVRDEPIDQALVKVEPALLHRAAARRQNARPRGRKPIGGKIAACEQIDIVAAAVVMVAGDVAGIAVLHAPGRVGEDIPDAFAASVLVDRAFDLIARGRRAPHKVGGKRTVVGSGGAGARNSTRGEQAERRRQQPPARHDQHRGRAAPAGAHGREGGGIGTKSAKCGRNIGRRGDGSAVRGVLFMISPDLIHQRCPLVQHNVQPGRRYDFWPSVLLVILQHIGHKDLSGITWAGAASSALEPLREKDFSLFAVRRASRALAAAAAFGPDDIEASALFEPPQSRSLVASGHGLTFFASRKFVNAPTGIKTRQPIMTCSICRVWIR